jgi:hypothetical protein
VCHQMFALGHRTAPRVGPLLTTSYGGQEGVNDYVMYIYMSVCMYMYICMYACSLHACMHACVSI